MQFLPRALAKLLLATAFAMASAAAQAAGLRVDGDFSDWPPSALVGTDPAGDAPPGRPDFGAFHATDEGGRLFLRFEVGREIVLQASNPSFGGNDITLLIDADGDTATGLSREGLGVDFAVDFGTRSIRRYRANGTLLDQPRPFPIGMMTAPTHSSEEFEMRVDLSALLGGRPTPAPGTTMRFVLLDDAPGGDRSPNTGSWSYTVAGNPAPPVEPISFDRTPGAIRLYNQNVENDSPAANPLPFARLLAATQPDLIAWQETYNWTPAQGIAWMNQHYPHPGGGPWFAAQVADCILFSPWPILQSRALDGNLLAFVALPPDISGPNLVIVNAHTPCCETGNAGRDREHDRISSTWRNLLAGTGPFAINPNSPALFVGDFNMVGFRRQLETIQDGTIIDPAQFGADFAPGRAEGSLRSVRPRHSHQNEVFTWYRNMTTFSPGLLDWIFYTGDVVEVVHAFAIMTPSMTAAELAEAGLQANDTLAADHLPLIVDMVFANASSVDDWKGLE